MEQITGSSWYERRLAATGMLFSRGLAVLLAPVRSARWLTRGEFVAFAMLLGACSGAENVEATIIRFQTTLGNIDVRLYDTATPLHTANILSYINSDRYDGTFIHRSAKSIRRDQNGNPILDNMGHTIPYDFVIQGGGFKINSSLFHLPVPSGWTAIPTFGTVQNEPGISNLRGTLALAKGSGVSSGSSQWFINLDDENDFLDQPAPNSNLFTVFGRLIRNTITVADAIADLQTVQAQNSGGPFSELPITDLDEVIANQDVTNNEAVVVSDVIVLNYPTGDYDFNGTVNALDYNVWKSTYGSTTNAAADGNGNGRVDAADYTIWRNTFGQTSVPGSGSGSLGAASVPEPESILLATIAGGFAAIAAWRRRKSR